MVWEHKQIANAKLEAKYEGEAVTLRIARRACDLAGRQLRLFLDRGLPAKLERPVEVHHG